MYKQKEYTVIKVIPGILVFKSAKELVWKIQPVHSTA